MKWPQHGSNPQYLFDALELPLPEQRIDFSANINPQGPPPILKENWGQLFAAVTDYPDPKGKELKKKLAEKEGLHPDQILLGNGGAEIISLVGRFLSGRRAVIVQPAFSEYEAACRVNGCDVDYHQLVPDRWEWRDLDLSSKLRRSNALFLCNPNNPTGVCYPKSVIAGLLKECEENECFLVIDEAFYDFLPDYDSLVPFINENPHLLIIRSMTKMFAIPGLRLGYLVGAPSMIRKLEALQPHWSINALALQAGEWCLESESFVKETRELIERERTRLFAFYQEKGFLVSPSSVNFYLLKDPSLKDQMPFFRFLLEKGMIPRHTMNFPGVEGGWLRFAIKGGRENSILMEAISEWQNHRRSFL
ncbi:threonine-phosphate decarboxylase CobD [Mesobacillus foraminis]|uniref:threonine-phosphate decarboxylase CobD n=1 Tax=Mesobacillus foraminis TaxID=279826 RepID=UPI00399FDCFF